MKLEFEKGKVPEHVFTEVQDLAARYFLHAEIQCVSSGEPEEQIDAIVLRHYIHDYRDSFVGSGMDMIDGDDAETACDIMAKTESELYCWKSESGKSDHLLFGIAMDHMVDAMTRLTATGQVRTTPNGYSKTAAWIADGIAKRAYAVFKSYYSDNDPEIPLKAEADLTDLLKTRLPLEKLREVMPEYTQKRVPLVETLLWANAEAKYHDAIRGGE